MRPWHVFAGTLYSFSIYLSLVTSAAITIPDLSIFQSSIQNFSTGLTIPPGLIDPRFSIIPRYIENVPLPRNSLLVIAVNTMSTLAMRDFNGLTASFQSAREPGYDDFYITMKVKAPATQVHASIAVWGLYSVISNMQIEDNFVEANVDLTWDGNKVASLRFQTRDTASAQSIVEEQGV